MDKDALKVLSYISQHPNGRSAQLEVQGIDQGRIAEIVAYFISYGYVKGVDATHNSSPHNEWIAVNITHSGRSVLAEGSKSRFVTFLAGDWKWIVTTLIAILALVISLLKK